MKFRSMESLYILAIMFGLTRIFGFFTGIPFFNELGRAIAISPLPSPYTRVEKILPSQMEQQLSFACEEKADQQQAQDPAAAPASPPLVWHYWDNHFRNQIPGPHRRTITILNFFSQAEQTKLNPEAQSRFEQMNQFYFCQKDAPLAQVAHCGPEVQAVHFRWTNPRVQASPIEVRHECSL